jgi:hypothetical protein
MPRPKSILQRIQVDEAQHAHNCQHNNAHRVECGDKRLRVWKQRSYEHYCVSCALDIIARDIIKLQEIAEHLRQ